MKVNLSKIEDISTIDYPGKACTVVFFNECPFRCAYCYNKQTWTDVNYVDLKVVQERILVNQSLITSVVFSGGEPTQQLEPLLALCKFCKSHDLLVGIETCGYYPERLLLLRDHVDQIFLDLKAPLNYVDEYFKVTGVPDACLKVNQTLRQQLPLKLRVVEHPNFKQILESLHTTYTITTLPLVTRSGHK